MFLSNIINAISSSDLESYQELYGGLFSTYILPAFFFFILLELSVSYINNKKYYVLSESIVDIGLFLGKAVFEVLTISLVLYIHLYIWEYRFFEFKVTNLTGVLMAMVIADFIYYLVHLTGHKWKIGWMTHVVHHSLLKINILSSVRQGWTNFLSLTWLVPIPFILLGLHPLWIEFGLGIIISYQFWLHTETIGRLAFFEWIINTPNLHRVHHSSQSEFRDKNFGGVLMIWDHLFRTYEGNHKEKDIVYGVEGFKVNSKNPFAYILKGLKTLRSD